VTDTIDLMCRYGFAQKIDSTMASPDMNIGIWGSITTT
jgi:hypothetical protein